MEVHHHPKVEKKNFKEYLLEGLMIFIAVTLGFFAENLREHIGNRKKEKEYVLSLVEDIKKDTLRINYVIKKISQRNKGIDTFLSLLSDPAIISNSNRLFRLREDLGFPDFIYTDRTIQQLKNTGELRLVRTVKTSNLIIAYDADARNVLLLDNILNNIIDVVIRNTNHILDFSTISGWTQGLGYNDLKIPEQPIPLLMKDRNTLIEYYNNISDYKRFALGFSRELENLESEGIKLIAYLRKKYHLPAEN